MRLLRQYDTAYTTWHRLAGVVAVLAQLFASTGLPVPSAPVGKDTSVPFPCQSRPCGCRTAQQCWAGACCCFTMREKLAWAAEHGFAPPPHAAAIAASETVAIKPRTCPHCLADAPAAADHGEKSCCTPKAKTATCCDKDRPTHPVPADDFPAPTLELVIGVFALQCHGQSGVGVTAAPPALPADVEPVRFDPPLVVGAVESRPVAFDSHRGTPPTPPPRSR